MTSFGVLTNAIAQAKGWKTPSEFWLAGRSALLKTSALVVAVQHQHLVQTQTLVLAAVPSLSQT